FLDKSEKPKKLLTSERDRIKSALQNHSEYSSWLINEEINDLRGNSQIFVPEDVEKINFRSNLTLFGRHKGLRGRYILFENHGNIFALDYRYIIGRFIKEYVSD